MATVAQRFRNRAEAGRASRRRSHSSSSCASTPRSAPRATGSSIRTLTSSPRRTPGWWSTPSATTGPCSATASRAGTSATSIPHYFHARLSRQFDAVIHIDITHAVEPLERTNEWEGGELPET